jgi:hypothetical protein
MAKAYREDCNEIARNYLTKEHEAMTSTFGDRGKLRLNRVMNAIGLNTWTTPNRCLTPKLEKKRKRSTKVSGRKTSKMDKQAQATEDETKDNETDNDEESPSKKVTLQRKVKIKLLRQRQRGKIRRKNAKGGGSSGPKTGLKNPFCSSSRYWWTLPFL